MLDADRIVITCKTKFGSDRFPVIFAMTVTNRAEDPGTSQFFAVMLVSSTPFTAVLIASTLVSFAWKWKIAFALPSSLITAIKSIPCQIRWLGSRFAPISGPTASRSFNRLLVLYTQKPGCSSSAILCTLCAFAKSNLFLSSKESEHRSTDIPESRKNHPAKDR